MLLGYAAFANAPLKREELTSITAMGRDMLQIMEREWNWAPRDMWDIQGFIWETCQKRLGEGSAEMTDDELLIRFDGNLKFREYRSQWTEEQRGAFCRMARAVNAAGLDWYHTNIPETRFGRKHESKRDAIGTLGSLQLRKNGTHFQFSHQHEQVDLMGSFAIDQAGAERLAAQIDASSDAIANWQALDVQRPGKWPDEHDKIGSVETKDMNAMNPSNLILYGPPGTGKTYATMKHAVQLCGEQPNPDRADLRTQYERLRKEKRIEFVTFHQNYAYEEFVEGLRPQTGNDDGSDAGVGFTLKPRLGIFRNLCQLASAAVDAAASGKPFSLDGRNVFKMSLGRAGSEDHIFLDAIENGDAVLGWGGEIDWSPFESYEAIHERWNQDHPGTNGNDANIIQTTKFRADMVEGDIIVVSFGNKLIRAIGTVAGPYRYEPDGTSEFSHKRKVDWLKVFREPIDRSVIYDIDFMQWSCYALKEEHLNRSALENLLPGSGGPAEIPKQYVLVIDEINRANISKVFGELITLIEPDKRLGMDEQLTVRLPYSDGDEDFGVPANLHIVGTMNTADRSITQIDTALRRRFRFEEIPPESGLLDEIDNVDLPRVLDVINARIEYLLDRDHAVGHAFFMGDGGKDLAAINDTMRFKIIPLLQEYFFDDWRSIAAVLGKGFVRGTTLPVPPGVEDRGERTRWSIRWAEGGKSGFPADAYDLLIQGSEAEVDGESKSDVSDGIDDVP